MKQLYEIRAVRPIRRPGYPYIGKPTRLYLEMDEVKQFMEYGSVYRIFDNSTENPVRVTGEKLSELHNRGISNYVEKRKRDFEKIWKSKICTKIPGFFMGAGASKVLCKAVRPADFCGIMYCAI